MQNCIEHDQVIRLNQIMKKEVKKSRDTLPLTIVTNCSAQENYQYARSVCVYKVQKLPNI